MKNFVLYLKKTLYFDPETGTKTQLILHWLINLAYIGLWVLGSGIVGLYFAKVGYGPELFWSYLDHIRLLLLNVIPGGMMALLLLFISGRVWPAIVSSGLLTLGVAVVNHYKILLRSDPLLFSDISNIAEAAQMGSKYTFTISPALILTFVAFILATLIAIFFMKARIRRPVLRIGGAVIVIILSALLYTNVYSSEEVYTQTDNLDVEFASGHRMSQWSDKDKYICRGYMYPFIHSASKMVNLKPDGYDRKEVAATLASLESSEIPENERVNIISIMLEAYCDLSVYENVGAGDIDPYEFFHALQQESYHGNLVTNIFAGGTIDTERCFISGSNRMYEYRSPADSYVRYFADMGYRTEFCHPGYDWFYNRRNVAEYLGFGSAYFRYDRYDTPDISGDDILFADILSLYEESKAAGEPYFNFSVTYQNHGPYSDEKLNDSENSYVDSPGLSEAGSTILNNYLEGIHRTDMALEDMVNTLRADPEPVVLVLFGDHKPWLGDDSWVYSELGIGLSMADSESYYNYFETPFIIWANDAAKEVLGSDFAGESERISPCFLMMKLFDLAGWQGDGYMQALRSLHEIMPIASSSGIYYVDGGTTSFITGEPLERLRTIYDMQYYRMKDWN